MDKSYIFELSYGKRMDEKKFIKDVLDNFNNDTLVGANIFVNNNPYSLEFLLHMNFAKDADKFDLWLSQKYKEKKKKYNYFIGDLFFSMSTRGYNSFGLIDSDMIDMLIDTDANNIFLFPDEATTNSRIKGGLIENSLKVFLSHSSKDKDKVDYIFDELQKHEIRAWYDKYEIDPGDSIVDKINEGLNDSEIGLLFLSQNFFNPSSGWPKSEMNYFIQKRMKDNSRNFICINIDVPNEDLPPLVQDYLYVNIDDSDAIERIVRTIKKKIRK